MILAKCAPSHYLVENPETVTLPINIISQPYSIGGKGSISLLISPSQRINENKNVHICMSFFTFFRPKLKIVTGQWPRDFNLYTFIDFELNSTWYPWKLEYSERVERNLWQTPFFMGLINDYCQLKNYIHNFSENFENFCSLPLIFQQTSIIIDIKKRIWLAKKIHLQQCTPSNVISVYLFFIVKNISKLQ